MKIKNIILENLISLLKEDQADNTILREITNILTSSMQTSASLLSITKAQLENKILNFEGEIRDRFKFTFVSNDPNIKILDGNFELSEDNVEILVALEKSLDEIKIKIIEWIQ